MYSDFQTVPDFGAYFGVTYTQRLVNENGTVLYTYSISSLRNSPNAVTEYDALLIRSGFSVIGSFDAPSSPVLVYLRENISVSFGLMDLNVAVMLSDDAASSTPPGGDTTPPPPPPPPPTQPPASIPTIPGGGNRSIQVNRETDFSFTPNQSGLWVFYTFDNGNSDPFLALYDSNGIEIIHNDDGGVGFNALFAAPLVAGTTYILEATFYNFGTGNYKLGVYLAPIFPSDGGTVRVNGTTVFSFTPSQSGQWEFRTSNNGSSNPIVILCDINDRYINGDNDSGEGLNALFMNRLTAGTTYIVFAEFFTGDQGSYDLTITRR